jgi:putative SbcD/Mre11-related phosphoesterase
MTESSLRPLIPFPALLIEEGSERTLVVADLHIGWEVSLVEKGIHIPSQISKIQTKLLQLVEEFEPERLIFLGDVKQTIPRISFEEWKSVPEFFEMFQKFVSDISVIVGNHDGDLEPLTPRSVKIFSSEGIVVGKKERIGLFHGHAWPSPEVLGCEVLVMGHIHPVLWFKDRIGLWTVRQVWVKARCDARRLAKAYLKYHNVNVAEKVVKALKEKFGVELREPKLIIIPAFNELVGGVSLNRFDRRLIGPLLGSGSIRVNDAELYLLDGTYVGTVKQIRSQLGG